LDHIAVRTFDRDAAVKFLTEMFGYTVQENFDIPFEEGDVARCTALQPGDRKSDRMPFTVKHIGFEGEGDYHTQPEIFVTEGNPGSIVHRWCEKHGGSQIHHCAYRTDDIHKVFEEWKAKGIEFSSEKPIYCPEEGLTQIFTREIPVLGLVIELIEREKHGFCKGNVKKLISGSAVDLKD
jgi:4-hydroxyphenylpyruvate dioxygenase-like putative hemolysin